MPASEPGEWSRAGSRRKYLRRWQHPKPDGFAVHDHEVDYRLQPAIYSTSILGADATSLTLDRAGNLYVSGWADATFRPTSGAYLATPAGAFAMKLDRLGAVKYATYLDFIQTVISAAPPRIAADSQGQL